MRRTKKSAESFLKILSIWSRSLKISCSKNENAEDREKLFYTPPELMRTEKGKEYYQGEFEALMELNDILEKYTETLLKIEGEWIDYQTLPEKIFDVES